MHGGIEKNGQSGQVSYIFKKAEYQVEGDNIRKYHGKGNVKPATQKAERFNEVYLSGNQLADNDIIRARVEKASICVYRAAIDSVFQTKAKISREDRQKLEPLARRFFELCRKYHALKIRECSIPEWRPVAAEIRQIESIIEELEATTGLQLS